MLVKVKRNQKVVLPDSICHELGISTGDRLKASVKEGRIVLQRVDHQDGETDGVLKEWKGQNINVWSSLRSF